MALTKRTRFILIQSTANSNVTDDNMEPYHISIFRRSSSMPPLPRVSLINSRRHDEGEQEQRQQQRQTILSSRYQQPRKTDSLTTKLNKLNIHAMKRKSARIGMRLSSAFGLTAQTIDEEFNFQEHRFRAIEKFLKLFLRNTYTSIDTLRESFMIQVNIAEDFEELLIDKIPDLPQQFVRFQRSLLENAFIEFCSHIEAYVIYPINNLIKLFISPSNLISKRNKKLLDYDSAQSAYEKVKDQQLKQAKQVLDLSKQTYEILNSQLLEQLPILYETTCQILSICLAEFLRGHCRLMQQIRISCQLILNQIITPLPLEQLNWQEILNRFTRKITSTDEHLFQLTITAKNFSEKLKTISTIQTNNLYNYDKEIYDQTEEIRSQLQSRYPEQDLFLINSDYPMRTENLFRSGDLVGIIREQNENNDPSNCFVDNGVTQGYIPHSMLIPFLLPSPPIRQDRAPQPLPRTTLKRTIETSSHENMENNERIYLNESGSHQYASINPDTSLSSTSNEQDQIYIALYDFEATMAGVLSLQVGDRLKVLRHLDDDGNEEWCYVEKLDETKAKGYVPANYIQPI